MAKDKETTRETFGPNVWLVDEMYRRYLDNPKAVAESWREFFEDYQPSGGESSDRKARSKGDGAARPAAGRRQPDETGGRAPRRDAHAARRDTG